MKKVVDFEDEYGNPLKTALVNKLPKKGMVVKMDDMLWVVKSIGLVPNYRFGSSASPRFAAVLVPK